MKQEGVEKAEVPEGAWAAGQDGASEVPVARRGLWECCTPHPCTAEDSQWVRLSPSVVHVCLRCLQAAAWEVLPAITLFFICFTPPPQFKKIADFKGNI